MQIVPAAMLRVPSMRRVWPGPSVAMLQLELSSVSVEAAAAVEVGGVLARVSDGP